MPLLAGSSFGDSRGIPAVTWLSALGAIVGVSLLEQSGAAPGIGDVWSLLSAIFFGVQVWIQSLAVGRSANGQDQMCRAPQASPAVDLLLQLRLSAFNHDRTLAVWPYHEPHTLTAYDANA